MGLLSNANRTDQPHHQGKDQHPTKRKGNRAIAVVFERRFPSVHFCFPRFHETQTSSDTQRPSNTPYVACVIGRASYSLLAFKVGYQSRLRGGLSVSDGETLLQKLSD